MRFELFGALRHMAGPDIEVATVEPVQLGDLLEPLAERLGRLVPYGPETTEAQLLSNLSFFRGGRMLRLADRIEADDIITVILPATGG